MQSTINPHWDDVRLFLALSRERALAPAGRRVGLDASTLSRRLAALEAQLGARLFDRTREGLVATAAAERLLPAAEAMEAAHRQFATAGQGLERAAEGVVRLSVLPGLADVFVAPALHRLRARHPGICLEVDAQQRVVDLTRSEADLAIRSVRPSSGDLVLTLFMETRWVPVAAPALAARLGPVRDWSALPWVAWGPDLAGLAPARWLAAAAPGAELTLRTSHFATQVAAVEGGFGVALVPEPYLRLRRLARLEVTKSLAAKAPPLPEESAWLVVHRALRDVPRVAAVWQFLLDEAHRQGLLPSTPRPRRR